MSYYKLSPYATTVQHEDGWHKVVYHSTTIVKWNEDQLILNTGGWFSVTTKKKMNQASRQFGLGFIVYQKNGDWFVDYCNGPVYPFESDVLVIDRKQEA